MNKAVFLDRDGVINELVYYGEHGLLDSPATIEQFRLFPWAGKSIRKLREAGFKVIIASNQPGIAKRHFSKQTFERIKQKMVSDLAQEGASLDGEYYCFHHPESKVAELKTSCECRKPRPGLLLQASQDMDIDLPSSWMIGDGITDIQAGRDAGCKTILIGRMKCEFCRFLKEHGTEPDAIASSLLDALPVILNS